jgi:membrane-bound ClpP family serine protease
LYPVIYSACAAAWIFRSGQTDLNKTTETFIIVTVKICLLCGLLLYLAYAVFGLSAFILLCLLPVSLIAIALASFERPPFSGAEGLAITLTLLFPVYACKQFVLGFPDRHKLLLTPPDPNRHRVSDAGEDHELVEQTGVVTAPLRPMGSIEIDGVTHNAKTDTGCLLEVGTSVTVMRVHQGTLVVRKQDTQT